RLRSRGEDRQRHARTNCSLIEGLGFPVVAAETSTKEVVMRVGVPKEIKTHEYRVGLTPGAAREYMAAGHTVLVESNAGAGIGADDEAYRKAGAVVVETAAEIFAQADMVVKVKEPQPSEWVQLREGQLLFTYLHLAPDPDQTRG